MKELHVAKCDEAVQSKDESAWTKAVKKHDPVNEKKLWKPVNKR